MGKNLDVLSCGMDALNLSEKKKLDAPISQETSRAIDVVVLLATGNMQDFSLPRTSEKEVNQ